VPPSGHVAGVFARVDTERGVHKAPANEILMGITGLTQNINRSSRASTTTAAST
jgi:phage tail sheath protein FI